MITTSKHYIKYIRIVDNTGYENYLEQGQIYGVLEKMTGDIASYYRLDVENPYKEGVWVSIGRCSDMPVGYPFRDVECTTDVIPLTQKQKKSLEEAYDEPINAIDNERLRETLQRWCGGYIPSPLNKHTIDLPSMLKQPIQRIICIPDEGGHIVDLQRVQYISPLEDGSYKVTLVSGWEMKLTDKLYSREKLIGLWKGLQNKQA